MAGHFVREVLAPHSSGAGRAFRAMPCAPAHAADKAWRVGGFTGRGHPAVVACSIQRTLLQYLPAQACSLQLNDKNVANQISSPPSQPNCYVPGAVNAGLVSAASRLFILPRSFCGKAVQRDTSQTDDCSLPSVGIPSYCCAACLRATPSGSPLATGHSSGLFCRVPQWLKCHCQLNNGALQFTGGSTR